MPHALVTGATGFIGGHLVQRLRQRGYRVSCFVRPNSNRNRLYAHDPTFIVGDVTKPSSIDSAIKNVDVVFHLAGMTKSLRRCELFRINAEGVRNVSKSCARRTSPPTLILASSLAAAGPSNFNRECLESDSATPVSNYGKSKLAGEREAKRFVGKIPITILRPPIVFGEADRDGLAMFESIARWNVHLVPGLYDCRISVIHGEDLAAAMISAFEKGHRLQSGDRVKGLYYASASETPTYAELGRMIGRSLGRDHLHVIHSPKVAVWFIALINELSSQLKHRPHILGLDKAREATAGSWACNGTLLRRDTGFAPEYSLAQRLSQTAVWYTEQGWLKCNDKRLRPMAPVHESGDLKLDKLL